MAIFSNATPCCTNPARLGKVSLPKSVDISPAADHKPAMSWDSVVADNDNQSSAPEQENSAIRPTIGELLRCLPSGLLQVMETCAAGDRAFPPGKAALLNLATFSNHRIAHLGGIKFATARRDNPEAAQHDMEVEDIDMMASNVSGKVLRMPWAGTLTEYRTEGGKASMPSQKGRERRVGAKGTDFPRSASKVGALDGEGASNRVRGPVDVGYGTDDRLADDETVVAFRTAHPGAASVLDAAMTAANFNDVAKSAGKSSPHTGKRLLVAACVALREFREKEAA